MFGTHSEVVSALRGRALDSRNPAEMLRAIVAHHPGDVPDRNLFYQYFTEAFCFSDGDASPLFGWLPGGAGELTDADIDRLMCKRIGQQRGVWEFAA